MKKRAAAGGVQMFSFLDAMICTLGALLVLLHAFARDRENDVVRKAEAKAAEQSTIDVKAELETLEWRIEQLREVRAKTEAQLSDERLRLAHVEDHERRLQEKFKELQIAAAELARLNESKDAKTLRNQAELEAAKIRLAKAKEDLEKAREDSKHAASYSVVPYEGSHATRRRPVYIECREESMVLQPEGVELVPEDFAGFLGAGNPLASALRGTREYYARQTVSPSQPGEPYPLLLVRPEGIMTYYAARSALGSWGADFGYELIGSDWELKFPPADERLAQLLRQIVSDSRMRMRELMVMTNQVNAKRHKVALRPSANGGFVADRRYSSSGDGGGSGPGSFESMESSWLSGKSSKAADRAADGDASGGGLGGNQTPTGGFGNGNGGSTPGAAPAGSDAGTPHGSQLPSGVGGNGSNIDSMAAGRGPGGGATDRQTGHDESQSEFAGPSSGEKATLNGNSTYGALANGQPRGQYNGTPDGITNDQYGAAEASPANLPAGATGGASATQSPGEMRDAAGAAEGSGAGQTNCNTNGQPNATAMSQGSPSSGGGGTSSSGEQSQSAMPHFNAHGGTKKTQSLAKRRGRDWGLQDAEDHMSPVTRPVLVRCYSDRLVIVPEDRTRQAMVTPLGGAAAENIDEFVVNVWKHTKQWGTAGKGLFWKPTLVMDVAPGGNDRYTEIQELLADSGLDVRRRNVRGAATAAGPSAANSHR
jgi:hypothetical protein